MTHRNMAMTKAGTITHVKLQIIYVTWAGVICLICTHEPEGAQYPRASADISGKSRLQHVTYVM